jgi:hypothetical protein
LLAGAISHSGKRVSALQIPSNSAAYFTGPWTCFAEHRIMKRHQAFIDALRGGNITSRPSGMHFTQ